MKSYKIKKATFNNRKKVIEIEYARGSLSLPYSKLMTSPSSTNPIKVLYVDKELGNTAITYELKDGTEDSVPLDAFLDFNKDPDYIRATELHRLTLQTIKLIKGSGMSKREICRRMNTSLSQLARILDPTNYSKTIDQLFKVSTILGAEMRIEILDEAV